MSERGGCKRCQAGIPHEFNHGTSTGYGYHLCRCTECKQWARGASVESYWANRDRRLEEKRRQRERNLEAHRARERARSSKPETKATAKRRKEKLARVPVTRSRKWMPHERALVLREDLSVLELAYMLQRSPTSVQAQRDWLRNPEAIRERNRRWREENYEECIQRYREKHGITPRGQRTHCKRGHLYDDENTYKGRHGQRYCKTCRKKPAAPPRPVLTHCPQGHAYSPENTRVYGNGYKKCKQCDRDKHRNNVCKNGHEFTPENTRYCGGSARQGVRRCVVCDESRQRTHCPHGHEYSADNTHINARGARICKTCRRASRRRAYAQSKEMAA